jgi:hypothetical protein
MSTPAQSDAAIAATIDAEAKKIREAAVTPPPAFRDERPAPTSPGAATKRNAARRNSA